MDRPTSDFDKTNARLSAIGKSCANLRERVDRLTNQRHPRSEYILHIAHDIRTPLSALRADLETLLIRTNLSADERRRYQENALRHTVRLGTLLNELCELARLDSIDTTPNRETFSLAELVQDTAIGFLLEAERKSISLSIETGSVPSFTIGDVGLIQRALENLLRNAICFAPADSTVEISLSQREDSVAVAVSDDGPGIGDEHLPRIFDRYYRIDDHKQTGSESVGLGLAIVKRILDLHESRIVVISKPGEGARFEFELPLLERAD